jgi:hypothetical protein
MPRYVKKPVEIEAVQWFKKGDHKDVKSVKEISSKASSRKCKSCGGDMNNHGWVNTLEGGHVVCPGDFIITGVAGETYPCKPDIFEKTYEKVDE